MKALDSIWEISAYTSFMCLLPEGPYFKQMDFDAGTSRRRVLCLVAHIVSRLNFVKVADDCRHIGLALKGVPG